MSQGNQCVRLLLVSTLSVLAVPAMAADILSNGNFDAPMSAPWVELRFDPQYPLIVTSADAGVPAQSGNKLVFLGGWLSSTTEIYQDVAVPVGQGKLKLTGFMRIQTAEAGGGPIYDNLYLELRTTGNVLLETLGHRSNLDANTSWTPFSFDASGDYSGQTVRLRIRATNDESNYTNFFLDTFVLDASSTVNVDHDRLATSRVSSAAPNPTRGIAHLRLDLAGTSRVRVWICDLSGRIVKTISEGELAQGHHELIWDGTDATSKRVAPGTYFSRISVDGRLFSQTIVLIR